MKKYLNLGAAVALILIWMACSTDNRTGQTSTDGMKSPDVGDVVHGIRVIDDPLDIADKIDEKTGDVVLVNFWATWCIPCKEEMPDLVRLSDKYDGDGLTVIGVNLNEAAELDGVVAEFVDRVDIRFPLMNYVGDAQVLQEFFSEDWRGELPATFIFDPRGNLQGQAIGTKVTFESVDEAVQRLQQEAMNS